MGRESLTCLVSTRASIGSTSRQRARRWSRPRPSCPVSRVRSSKAPCQGCQRPSPTSSAMFARLRGSADAAICHVARSGTSNGVVKAKPRRTRRAPADACRARCRLVPTFVRVLEVRIRSERQTTHVEVDHQPRALLRHRRRRGRRHLDAVPGGHRQGVRHVGRGADRVGVVSVRWLHPESAWRRRRADDAGICQ